MITIDIFKNCIEKAYFDVVNYIECENLAVLFCRVEFLTWTGTHCKVGKLICR